MQCGRAVLKPTTKGMKTAPSVSIGEGIEIERSWGLGKVPQAQQD